MLSGCGHSGPERVIVSGAVTYEGHPVEHGVITFEQTDPTTEFKSSSQIENGHYLTDSEGGVPVGNHKVLIQVERELKEYFAGRRQSFSISLDMRGTAFQKQVWEQLLAIPFGETRTYGQLARNLGNPKATRAVGAANGKNPVAIIAPCHRVIGSTGKLTGFAGGLDAKARLLNLEGRDEKLK